MPPSILTKFLPKTEEKKDYFLALEICQEKIKAASCEIYNGEVEVLATAMTDFTGSWEDATAAADEVISQVEEKLPPETQVDKVVLGLPTEYTQDGKIEASRLVNIKELLKKLSLVPLGFVEIPLAIVHFLQKQEGGPQTLLLVRVGLQLDVSLVRIGKITDVKTVLRTENIAFDLEKAITSFTGVEILPSRILLFDGQELNELKQILMNHPWVTRASFLHFPKIETASSDLDIKAIAFAGASEIAQVVEMAGEDKAETSVVEGEGDFGFVKGEDISEKELPPTMTEEIPSQSSLPRQLEQVAISQPSPLTRPKISLPKIPFSQLGNFLVRLKQNLGVRLPKTNKLAIVVIILVIILIIIGAGYIAASWYIPTAKVSLLLKTQTLQQPLEIALNPKLSSVDEVNKEIPSLTIEVDGRQTKKMTTTAKKTVGEPAKGEVTIYNKTTNSKSLKKGTIILSANNLKFSLNDDVNVASASEGMDYTLTPGKQNTQVTAMAIGPEGNLGVGQEFHFADYPVSSYVAKNSVAFSGGTSREVSVVGKGDQEKLLASASTELTEQAKKDLQGKVSQGEKIIEKTLSGAVTSKKFDKEVDAEGSELGLDLSMHFTASGFREGDLLSILEKTITSSIPAGFEFKRENVAMEIGELTKEKDGTQVLKVNFLVNLLPRINQEDIKKNLLGKNLSQADSYLRGLGNIAGYEINFGRQMPFGQKVLPRLGQNITIETAQSK